MIATVHVENLLHGGRALVGYTEEGERVAGWPEVAYEAIRASNHLTSHCPIPAPTAYRILGDLTDLPWPPNSSGSTHQPGIRRLPSEEGRRANSARHWRGCERHEKPALPRIDCPEARRGGR